MAQQSLEQMINDDLRAQDIVLNCAEEMRSWSERHTVYEIAKAKRRVLVYVTDNRQEYAKKLN